MSFWYMSQARVHWEPCSEVGSTKKLLVQMWHLNPLSYSLLPLWCLPICKNQHHSSSQTEHIGDSTMGITFSIPQVYLSIPMWIDWIKWKCICVYLNTSKKTAHSWDIAGLGIPDHIHQGFYYWRESPSEEDGKRVFPTVKKCAWASE